MLDNLLAHLFSTNCCKAIRIQEFIMYDTNQQDPMEIPFGFSVEFILIIHSEESEDGTGEIMVTDTF